MLDVNPRFYTSLPLALACGVNLPGAWHAVVVGDPPPSPGPYRLGVGYRWLEGEMTAAVRLRKPSLLPACGRRVGAMWARDDPLASTLLGVEAALVRARRRLPRA